MNEKGFGKAKLDMSSDNPGAIRGREQQLIEANGGAQSEGGTSGNAINGVSQANPNAAAYENSAIQEMEELENETILPPNPTDLEPPPQYY
jgi:hypothetical protein